MLGSGWEVRDIKVVPKVVSTSITNPVFKGVAINAAASTDITPDGGYVTFTGTYNPLAITAADNTKLYLGADNTLYWPSDAMTINAFRAYFQLNGGITAGDVAKARLFFGDDGEAQSISATLNDKGEISATLNDKGEISATLNDKGEMINDKWYTLDGRRLAGKPTKRGVYVSNGRKIIIK